MTSAEDRDEHIIHLALRHLLEQNQKFQGCILTATEVNGIVAHISILERRPADIAAAEHLEAKLAEQDQAQEMEPVALKTMQWWVPLGRKKEPPQP